MSKADQFGNGSTIHLGSTGNNICPVSALLQYLAIRPTAPGPLFISHEEKYLPKEMLIHRVRQALADAGIDSSFYSGHSFRIGAATTAATCGLNDSLIKTLGCWESSSYLVYIKIPPTELARSQSITSTASAIILFHVPITDCIDVLGYGNMCNRVEIALSALPRDPTTFGRNYMKLSTAAVQQRQHTQSEQCFL